MLMRIEEKQSYWVINLEGITRDYSFAELLHSADQLVLEAIGRSHHLAKE